jgi:glycosyltransferase involved in cell wall biosynthesis
MTAKIAYLVTEDWYFIQHRLPMARAAKAAGFEVHVLTRIGQRRQEIEQEGFIVHPLSWRRRAFSPVSTAAAVAEVGSCLGAIGAHLVHNIAVKPAVVGSLACLWRPGTAVVNSVNGLGSAFLARSLGGRLMRAGLRMSFAVLFNRRRTMTIVQNPDDKAMLLRAGVRPGRIVLIPGSGVDTGALPPLPDPPPPMRAAFVGRMVANKGLRTLIAAHRLLRSRGLSIELLLAGAPDPESPTSIPPAELAAWAREPGVRWLGHVADIAPVWAQSHFAVLPTLGGEGLPKSLLEAAACGRPMIATDTPGCREIVLPGKTGLLVPVEDAAALAEAMAKLAAEPELRRLMGAAARQLAESMFSAADIGRQTVALYCSLIS